MGYYQLRQMQTLPLRIEQAWDFFSRPENLDTITPDDMRFVITSPVPQGGIYAGQIITYKVSPLLGIPLSWVTEITHVNAPYSFVDAQLHGPYKFWHHEHHFKQVKGGVEMTDILYYAPPLGIMGDIAAALFIRRRVDAIFAYRRKKLEQLFPI